nr:hypothetical protein CFP56_10452 [Quercus suber]
MDEALTPKGRHGRLELCPVRGVQSEDRAERETDAADEVPEADVPAQGGGRGLPPVRLRLDHKECAGDDEADAADDLGDPVRAVELRGSVEVVIDAWQRGEPGDVEDGSADGLGQAGQEAEVVERPAEATDAVLVDGLEHEEEAPDLEDRGADERGDPATVVDASGGHAGRVEVWQEDEEGVDDPDHAAPGVGEGDEVTDVPDGVVGGHAPDALQHRPNFAGGPWRRFRAVDDERMSALAIVA